MKLFLPVRIVPLLFLVFASIGCDRKPGNQVDLEWKSFALDSAWSSGFHEGIHFVYNGTPFNAYPTEKWEARGLFGDVCVMNYVGGRWEPVGPPFLGDLNPGEVSLFVHDGIPYLAVTLDPGPEYQIPGSEHRLMVMRFDGVQWKPLGDVWYSNSRMESPSLFVKGGVPYVAFRDSSASGCITVLAYDGAAWKRMGNTLSGTNAYNVSLEFSGSEPWIAYCRRGSVSYDSGTISFLKFNGTDWKAVGSGIPSACPLRFQIGNSAGMPTVAFAKTVGRFNGTSLDKVYLPDTLHGGWARFSINDTLHTAFKGISPTGGSLVNYLCSPNEKGMTAQTKLKEVPAVKQWRYFGEPNQFDSRYERGHGGLAFVFSNGTPFIAYARDGFANYFKKNRITVKKHVGGEWRSIGEPIDTDGGPFSISLSVSNDTPYIAYCEGDVSKVRVGKFNGEQWVALGSPDTSAGMSEYPSIYVHDDIPYLAYRSKADGDKASVFRFSESGWVLLGKRGLSAGYTVDKVSLVVDQGIPYVAFADAGLEGKWVVLKFNGSDWEFVGVPGNSRGRSDGVQLFLENGVPYLTYVDQGWNGNVVVKSFADSLWNDLNDGSPSGSNAFAPQLLVDSGTPYIVFQEDRGDSRPVLVRKFDGSDWQDVGWEGVIKGPSILAVNGGIPFVATQGDSGTSVMTYR